MKRLTWILTFTLIGLWGQPASAQLLSSLLGGSTTTSTTISTTSTATAGGVIVRTDLGVLGLQTVCLLNGCTVTGSIDGNLGQVFLVTPNSGLLPDVLAATLRLVTGILDAETDQVLMLPPSPATGALQTLVPVYLYDENPVNYYGTTVWDGYANQPAAQIINVDKAQDTFNVTGAGIVADIDTGVDPNHPALKPILLQGYDFTRNQPGGSEMTDLGGSTGSSCSSCQAAFVNQHTAAMLDQHTATMLDGTAYSAFGHGTEVAGVIHLVAPTAQIMPLKAFRADGTGDLSDILRAIYYGVQNHVNVINMSFDLTANSTELTDAINYAVSHNVMGVASTNDFDQRSSFSNYGDQVVWVAAPGENIVSTYPFGSYAASSGTSFSSPFVAGTVALILNLQPHANQSQAASAIAHAKWIGDNMGNGRLDVYGALSSLSTEQDGDN